MDLELKDKVILVSGASQGMGLAIAQQCAAEGAKISIAARNEAKLATACNSMRETYGTDAIYTCVDATQADDITQWVAQSADHFGRIDGLLVNAGGPPMGGLEDFEDDAWQAAFDLNLMSAVRMIRSALPLLKINGGSILTLTSSSIREPIDVLLLSNVMRAGTAALVKSLATQFAPYNIRVNNIIPGLIATDRIETLDQKVSKSKGISLDQQRQSAWANIPAGRYGKPEEFANAATFLLSNAASYINGTSLVVDGGKMKSL